MEDKDKVEYIVDRHTKVVLTGAKFFCPHCKKWKDASEFGMRHSHNTRGVVIRNQSYCKECR